MVDGGVSTIVSSCDAALRPSIMRAVGSAITPDGRSISVYLSRRQTRQLLQDVAASGRIAVVFSQPFSHRTLQVKTTSARTRGALPADQPVLQRYLTEHGPHIRIKKTGRGRFRLALQHPVELTEMA